MYYEINVSKHLKHGRYVHLFATAERSLRDLKEAREVYGLLIAAFPSPEFHMSVSLCTKSMTPLGVDETAQLLGPESDPETEKNYEFIRTSHNERVI